MSSSRGDSTEGAARHVPELDGVRGLAIGAVMSLHFVCTMNTPPMNALERIANKITSYGVWGVDLFFVLSGYLITGILYDAKGANNFFRAFYMRRTLRIFPLYYGVLAVLMLLPQSFLFAYAPGMLEVRRVQGWLWSYLTNFYLAGQGTFSIPYVSHFWSLAIEEHFYLVWPFVIAFVSRTAALRVTVALSVFALVLRIAFSYLGPTPLYPQVLTPCRLDSLCVGAWFALSARGPGGVAALGARALRLLPFAAAGVLFFSVLHGQWGRLDAIAVPMRTTLLAVFFGAFIALLAWEGGSPAVKRAFRARWLVTLGKYSYGLYIYHGIVAHVMLERGALAWMSRSIGSHTLAVFVNAVAGALLSLLVAAISYEIFESQFLRMKKWFDVRRPSTAKEEVVITPLTQ